MNEINGVLSEVIDRAPGVKSFRFKLEREIDFKPGQFFCVMLDSEEGECVRYFSFSNSPTERGYIEFTKRITDSPFCIELCKLKAGNHVKLKMPGGSFTFEGEHKKIAFLSGGIGITPIRSMLKYIADKKLATDAVLIYGNRTQEDIIFRKDLDKLSAENKNIHVIYTISSKDSAKDTWKGKTGHIDEVMIKSEIPDYRERVFFICGPPRMVDKLVSVLKDGLGIDKDCIKRENFVGY